MRLRVQPAIETTMKRKRQITLHNSLESRRRNQHGLIDRLSAYCRRRSRPARMRSEVPNAKVSSTVLFLQCFLVPPSTLSTLHAYRMKAAGLVEFKKGIQSLLHQLQDHA